MKMRGKIALLGWVLAAANSSWGEGPADGRRQVAQRSEPPKLEEASEPVRKTAPANAEPKAPVATRTEPPVIPKPERKLVRRLTAAPSAMLNGLDPVALVEGDNKKEGNPSIAASFDGRAYRFETEDRLKLFETNPLAYVPVLGGQCPVTWSNKREWAPGVIDHHVVLGNRLYLFASAENRTMFLNSASLYQDADLVLQGYSPVSLAVDEILRRGDLKYAAISNGFRVVLANEHELDAFINEPARYVPTMGGIDPISHLNKQPVFGLPRLSAVYKNRLFCFSNDSNRAAFIQQAEKYSDVDVAAGGLCPVHLIEAGKKVPGHYGISTVIVGQRYLFATEQDRDRFNQDPSKYLLRLDEVIKKVANQPAEDKAG